jgi:hypothetical protein
VFKSCYQSAQQNHDTKTANKSFESMTRFKYFGTTNTNLVHKINHLLNQILSSAIHFRIICHPTSYIKNIKTKNVIDLTVTLFK